jgi:DNA-binding MarR family transcriptional regulator
MDQPPRTDRASSPAGGQAATVSESKVEPKIDRFYVGLALKRAQHESRLAVNAELASLGTNISQVNVLREIEANPGVSSVQLATLAFLTPQSLGQQVAQMQERGLVERRPGPSRKLRHYITEAGEKLYREAVARGRIVDETIFEGFTDDELAALVETLRTIETRAAEARAHRKRLVIVDP